MSIIPVLASSSLAIEQNSTALTGKGLVVGLLLFYLAALSAYLLLRKVAPGRFWWVAFADNFLPIYFLPLLLILPLALWLNQLLVSAAAAILLLIAIIWFGRYFRPEVTTNPGGIPLKIITFNLYPYNQQLSDVASWIKVQDADIVLLQETPTVIGDAFMPLYEMYAYHALQDHENGYLIFSRYTITQQPEKHYVDESGWHLHQRVELDINGRPLVLYNVHTKMPHQEDPHIRLPLIPDFVLRYDETTRDSQINHLVETIRAESNPVVMTGDFNMVEYAAVFPALSGQLVDTFRQVGRGFGFTWPGGSSEELPDVLPPLARLDYVWLTASIYPIHAEVGPRLGSDHLPLIVTVGLLQ